MARRSQRAGDSGSPVQESLNTKITPELQTEIVFKVGSDGFSRNREGICLYAALVLGGIAEIYLSVPLRGREFLFRR